MVRIILSACVAMAFAVTTQAEGQRAGAFLLANAEVVPEEALPLVPQTSDLQEKNPWLAFVLSFVITGTGQFYNGENKKGVVMLAGAVTGFGMIVSQIENDAIPEDNGVVTAGAILALGSGLWSMIDAPLSANRINREMRQASFHITPVVTGDLVAANLTFTF